MSDYYTKKVYLQDYLTCLNSEGKVCPRLPKDWQDTKKYGRNYFAEYMDAICTKLHNYEVEYKTPGEMVAEVLKLKDENDRLLREVQSFKKSRMK
jgi:hypothetical protein